jgi:hypothetical protein
LNLVQHDTALLAAPSNGAAARAQAYAVLSALCVAPWVELRDWLLRLQVANTLLPFAARLNGIVESGLGSRADRDALLPLRTALASGELGARAKQVKARAELLNFFGRFDYQPEEQDWHPDHLAIHLEFMHYLAWLEATAEDADDPEGLRHAQYDFLSRHVCRRLPRTADRLAAVDSNDFLEQFIKGLMAFTQADRVWLAGQDVLRPPPG